MQGFNYSQLYQALQDWPVQTDPTYLNNINRLIFLGETRLVKDLNLEIFDVVDSITVSLGQTTIPKPPQSQPVSFTGNPPLGADSATLTAAWAQPSITLPMVFPDDEVVLATLTNNSTAISWEEELTAAQSSATAQVNGQFISERALWVDYSGSLQPLLKRSLAYVTMYQAAQGQPKYYAEPGGSVNWLMSPSADANTASIQRHYIQRPTSIVLAGNSFLGDNTGDCLFAACLMEAEHFLKMDDRYADIRNKYAGELVPSARMELQVAMRRGDYAPLVPVAALPGPPPPPAPPPQGQQ